MDGLLLQPESYCLTKSTVKFAWPSDKVPVRCWFVPTDNVPVTVREGVPPVTLVKPEFEIVPVNVNGSLVPLSFPDTFTVPEDETCMLKVPFEGSFEV